MERGEEGDTRKRSTDGGKDGRPSKIHRFVPDEAALRISLTLGWKRETLIRRWANPPTPKASALESRKCVI